MICVGKSEVLGRAQEVGSFGREKMKRNEKQKKEKQKMDQMKKNEQKNDKK